MEDMEGSAEGGKGVPRKGRERGERERRPGTQEAICRQNPVSNSGPPNFQFCFVHHTT